MPPRPLVAAFAVALALVSTVAANRAAAHGRSVSYSSFAIDESGADVSLQVALLELSRRGPEALPRDLTRDSTAIRGGSATAVEGEAGAETLVHELVLLSAGKRCEPTGRIARTMDDAGFVRFAWRVDCPTGAGALAIESRVLQDVAPSHLHFARVRFAAEPDAVHERVLTEAAPRFVVRAARSDADDGISDDALAPEGSRFRDYVRLGVLHILSGWDHLAFLFGLVLLAERLGAVARLVTGFTLAHSLTLALAVLDQLHPRAEAVEAVIAFSVVLVAAEKGWILSGRPRAIPLALLAVLASIGLLGAFALPFPPSLALGSAEPALSRLSIAGLLLFTACYFGLGARTEQGALRVALTFAFGLVHGLGFAGILVELELPADRLVPALAGFNLGVELGQLACVLVAWPLLALARSALPAVWRQWARDLALAGLAGLGSYWLFVRSLPF